MVRSPSDDGIDDDGAPLPDSAPPVDPASLAGPEVDAAPEAAADPVAEADQAAQAPRAIPSQEELDRIAVNVHIRRRPRYGVFIGTGMLLAGAAAFVWAVNVPQDVHENWGASIWAATLGAVGFGALLGAGVGVFADWRSRRK